MAEPWSSNDVIRTFSDFLSIGLILQAGSPHKVAKIVTSISRFTSYQFSKHNIKKMSYPFTGFSKNDVVGNFGESNFNTATWTEVLRIKSDE